MVRDLSSTVLVDDVNTLVKLLFSRRNISSIQTLFSHRNISLIQTHLGSSSVRPLRHNLQVVVTTCVRSGCKEHMRA